VSKLKILLAADHRWEWMRGAKQPGGEQPAVSSASPSLKKGGRSERASLGSWILDL